MISKLKGVMNVEKFIYWGLDVANLSIRRSIERTIVLDTYRVRRLRRELPATYRAPEVFQLRGEAVAVSPSERLVLDILSSPLSRRRSFSLEDFGT